MTYVIAGGGTGGHVYPGIAVADSIKQIDPSAQILFIGTTRGLEKEAVPKAGYNIEFIKISGIKGRSYLRQLRAFVQLPLAVLQSITILRRVKARAILGVGGYASGPALIAAKLLRIPIGVCEPNSVPGLTNRVLGKVAKNVFTAFKSTQPFFSEKKVKLYGNPIRGNLSVAAPKIYSVKEAYNILVIGGSQGAHALNEMLPSVFYELKKNGLDICVRHQTGSAQVEKINKYYQEKHIEARVDAYIEDMQSAYAWADLIICRAGAATCSEVMASGPAAIFVPLPSAIYNHQMLNAKELQQEGACLIASQGEITPEALAHKLSGLLKDPNQLQSMLSNARKLAKPDASLKIAKSFINRFSVWTIILCGIHFSMVA